MIPIAFIARRLQGTAFPGKMLTYPHAGQWYVDDEPVPGESGKFYVVGIRDIGKAIRCGASLPARVWHPRDIPQVRAAWVGTHGIYHDSSNTPAVHGDTVYRWTDIVNGITAEQSTGVSQPIYKIESGIRYLEFDGDNDWLVHNALNVFRNVKMLGCVSSASGTGASSNSGIFQTSRSGAFAYALQSSSSFKNVACRFFSGGVLRELSNADPVAGWSVVDGLVNGVTGEMYLNRDGAQIAYSSAGPRGTTQDTSAEFRFIGVRDAVPFKGGIASMIPFAGEALPTELNLNRLRQYAGLLAGRNLGLPIA